MQNYLAKNKKSLFTCCNVVSLSHTRTEDKYVHVYRSGNISNKVTCLSTKLLNLDHTVGNSLNRADRFSSKREH